MRRIVVLGPDGPTTVDPATPLLRADDLTVLRGEGIFETTRVLGGTAVDLGAHLARFRTSAAAVDVPLPSDADLVRTAAHAADGVAEGVLRLVATKGDPSAGIEPVRYALVTPMPDHTAARRDGIAAVTLTLGVPAELRRDAPWLLGGVKATSYAVAMAAQRAAAARGVADAIWVSGDGEVLEGTTSTVLVSIGGLLVTPPADELGLLPGLTLARLEKLCTIEVRRVATTELAAADEVLLAGSIRGVVPVVALDGRVLPVGPYGSSLPSELEADLRAHPDG